MSRTIEAIIGKLATAKRAATPAHRRRLTANWHSGLEVGGQVQRKLRLALTNVAARHPA
jgi:hypothetical protein